MKENVNVTKKVDLEFFAGDSNKKSSPNIFITNYLCMHGTILKQLEKKVKCNLNYDFRNAPFTYRDIWLFVI